MTAEKQAIFLLLWMDRTPYSIFCHKIITIIVIIKTIIIIIIVIMIMIMIIIMIIINDFIFLNNPVLLMY